MANIELDGVNKKIKVDSGDLTLDVPGDIILDADGGDVVFADGGTNLLKVTNSSSDVVLQPQVDTKDIVFKQYDGTVVATVEDNATFNIPASKLAIGGTAVTSTAAELNILDGVTATAAEINLIDGGTARGTTAIADGDGVLINDAGTMRMTTVQTLKTYIGGFDVSSITGATALATQPAATDEIVLSDNGTLKRLDIKHISNTPFFEYQLSGNQGLNNNTATKILWDSGTFDSDSILGSSKFTPAIAGYYFINALLPFDEVADTTVAYCMIYKNGSHYLSQASSSGRGTDLLTPHLSAILYLDGDDYVEIYGQHNHGSARNVIGNSSTEAYFSGFRLTGL